MDKTEIPPLASLYFYLTAGCNLACRHCWLAPKFDPDGTRYPVIAVDLFRRVLAEAKPLGLRNVKLPGGEPLLHPDIYEIIEIVKSAGTSLVIETNGLLLDDPLAAAIAGCSRPFVSVSLDGSTAAVHDRIRGVPGAFARALAGIKQLVKHNLKPQIIFTIMRDNVHQYEKIIPLAESLGAGSIKYNVIQPTEKGLALHEKGEDMTVSEYIEIGRRVDGELSAATSLNLFYDQPLAFRPLHRLVEGSQCGGTCGVQRILGVLADGTYALCGIGTSLEEMTFGRAGVDALETIWRENRMLNAVRRDIPEKLTGVCGRCLMREMCLGSCIAQNYYRTLDIRAPFWYCAVAEEEGLFPLSRLKL
jgi:SynChlorMet cassette radical SAM/SPASM protein ScmF